MLAYSFYNFNSDKELPIISLEGPKLVLEVLESDTIPIGETLKINKFGIGHSLRKQNDDVTYFGLYNDKNYPLNDFLFRRKNYIIENNVRGRLFQIKYYNETEKFYLKEISNTMNTFIKLDSETILNPYSFVQIGNSFIEITYKSEEDIMKSNCSSNLLNIKVYSPNHNYEPLNFQKSNSQIKIGRSSNCEVYIEDRTISRIHCIIEYNNVVGWVIKDARKQNYNLKNNKNCTWFYVNENYAMRNDLIFKFNKNIFQCHLYDH